MSSPKNTFPSAAFGARVFPQDGKSKSQGDKSSLQVIIETKNGDIKNSGNGLW